MRGIPVRPKEAVSSFFSSLFRFPLLFNAYRHFYHFRRLIFVHYLFNFSKNDLIVDCFNGGMVLFKHLFWLFRMPIYLNRSALIFIISIFCWVERSTSGIFLIYERFLIISLIASEITILNPVIEIVNESIMYTRDPTV